MGDAKLTEVSAATTPVDADIMLIVTDIATTAASHKITWANIKATLKTYFDGLYTRTVYKSADETVNNSSVLQDDDHLIIPVVANGIYQFKMTLIMNAAAVDSDFKYHFTVPAGTVMTFYDKLAAVLAAGTPVAAYDQTSTPDVGSLIGTILFTIEGIIVVSGTAGNVNLQWAQNTAKANNTKLLKGSNVLYCKIG